MSHRLFFGIRPPRFIREQLLAIMGGIENARWQDDAQLHVTLRFIGEVETHQADDIAEAAGSLFFEPFDLAIDGVDFFDSKGVPRLIYARIAESAPLRRCQRKLERIIQGCGVPAEARKYTPHMTLARLNTASGPLDPFLARHKGLTLGPWQVDNYILYESFLREQGSLYEPIVTYPAATP